VATGRRAVRRHRHLRQQRVGDQPGLHHRGPAQTVRPDERHPRPRHVRRVARLYPAHEGPGEPAHPDVVAAGAAGLEVAQADGIHDGQVRHDAVRARDRRGDCAPTGIASNTLWPRTMVATAAVQNLLGGDEAMGRARKPEVYSDAAYVIFNKPAAEYTGQLVAVRGRPGGVRRHRLSRCTTACPAPSSASTCGSRPPIRRATPVPSCTSVRPGRRSTPDPALDARQMPCAHSRVPRAASLGRARVQPAR
jgi:hypothetical protein